MNREYGIIASKQASLYKCKSQLFYSGWHGTEWCRLITRLHEAAREADNVEEYFQTRVVHTTPEAISFEYRRSQPAAVTLG